MRVYFKNLNGLRFIAAFLVILQHTSEYKIFAKLDLPNTFQKQFSNLGSYGVTIFFVLSGFLIFYLLFAEQKTTSTVNIKKFYIRRMLRIWPLYFGFGIVLIFGIDYVLSLLGSPLRTPSLENLFYLGIFSINLQMLFALPNKGIIELYWSVCIEEQFYLFAPWLVKKGHRKMLMVILILIATGIGSKFILRYLELHGHNFNGYNPLYFFTICRFDNFGIGALAAYIYFTKSIYNKVENIVTNKYIQVVITSFTLLYITQFIPQPYLVEKYFFSTIPALFFAYIILAASTGNFFVNLETPFLNLLGKYSYGIYVFHAVISELTMVVFIKYIPGKSVLIYDFLYPMASVTITCLVAGLSYELYEKKFMKLKEKFTIINHKQ